MAVRHTLVAFAAITLFGGFAFAAPPVDATNHEGVALPSLDVRSVSPWVDPDGTWKVRFGTASLPLGATLTYAIRQPLSGNDVAVRTELKRLAGEPTNGSGLQGPKTVAVSSLPTADGVAELDVAIRGSSSSNDRAFLPNAGIHPVVITVNSLDGSSVARQVLFLNRLPSGTSRSPILVGLLTPRPTSRVTFARDGSVRLDDATRGSIESLIAQLDALGSTASSVVVPPEEVAALVTSPDPADQDQLRRLRSAVGAHSVIRAPWADLHLESWATYGSLGDLETSLVQGQQGVATALGAHVDTVTWPTDPTVGPNAVSSLTQAGVRRVIVDPSRLTASRQVGSENPYGKRFTLGGSRGATLDALAVDPDVRDLLHTKEQPATALNLAMTELLASWFGSSTGHRGAVIAIDDATPTDTVAALAAMLDDVEGAPIHAASIDQVFHDTDSFTTRTNGRSSNVVRTLSPTSGAIDVRGLSRTLATLRDHVGAFRSIFGADDPSVTTVANLMATAQDRSLSAAEQAGYASDASHRIDADLHKISVPKPRSLTVTARQANIPLRFTNDLNRDARVRLHLRSPRLEFSSGQVRTLVLKPGTTRIDVPVRVQASGQFLLTVELRSADDELVIAAGRQSIRSTAFSGVGLILSGGALVVLVVWWIRTLRTRTVERTDERLPEAEEADR